MTYTKQKIWVLILALTLRNMTWHTLTNQKSIPISQDGVMTVFGTTDFISDKIKKKIRKQHPQNKSGCVCSE